jgi:hypothetical protein
MSIKHMITMYSEHILQQMTALEWIVLRLPGCFDSLTPAAGA